MDKNVLARATEDSDSPTPGYLYGEIARMTQHSFDTCLKVQEYLIGRLKKNKPNIKYKALQVIKHICREGRQEFRREMQKHVPTVKEALQFRGPPDPLRGDEYYRRVRDAAKDCLDAIFDTNVNAVAGISTRIKGVGNPEAAPQASGWFNRGSKDNAPTQFQVPGAYNTSGPPAAGYDAPGGYPGGYNGPAYPGSDANQYPSQQQQQPPGYGGAAPSYPGGPLPPYGSNLGGGHPGGNYPPPPGMTGLGNPIFEDKKGEGSKGFFEGLKEKVSFKSEPKVTFAGAPPGSHSAPDGWSFSTNRGPTSGAFNPNAPSTYNPSEPYRPNHQPPPPYNTSQVGGYTGPTSSYAAPSSGLTYSDSSEAESRQHKSQELRDRAYEGERQKGRVGGVWDSLPTPTLSQAAPQHRPSQRQSDDGPRPAERIQNEWAQEQQYVRRPSATGPPPSTSSAQPQQTFGRSGASSDGAYERGIIQGLCAPGGMRAVPPKDKLDAFLKSALTLDAEVVGPILDELLGTDASSWQVVSKALTVIDGLLATNGCETFHEYFTDNYDMILHVSTASDKAAVRDRAVKILHVLGKATSSTAAPSRRNSGNPAPSATSGDLLGGFDSPSSTPPQPSSQAPNVPPSSSSSGGLFAGLQTSSSSSVDGHAAPAAPQYTQQPQSVQATANMFGGLSLGSSSSSSDPSPSYNQTPANSVAASFDPLLQPPVQQQQQPQPTYAAHPTYNPNQFLAPPQQQQQYYGGGPPQFHQPNVVYLQPAQQQQHQQQPPLGLYQQQQYPPQQYQQQPQYGQPQQYLGKLPVSSSQVIGAAMIPTGYIAKTIHEPTDATNFDFMKRDDSFNFVKDHMKG